MAALKVAVGILTLAFALLLSACGGSGTASAPTDSSAQAFQTWLAAVDAAAYAPVSTGGLPSIPVDSGPSSRSSSAAGDPVVVLGADHINAYNYEDVGTAVRLTAPAAGGADAPPLAFAMYKIEGLAGLRPMTVAVECMPGMLEDAYYVGVADYTRMHWRFFGPFNMPEAEVDLGALNERFISALGNFYFLVVTHDGMSGLHAQTTVIFGEGGETRLPGAPCGLQASDGAIPHAVGLAWTAGPGAAWFEIYRQLAGNGHAGDPAEAWDRIGEALEPNYLDETAVPGTVYAYKVRAGNAAGVSGFSNVDTGYAGGEPPEGYRIHGWIRTPATEGVIGEGVPDVEVSLLGQHEPVMVRTALDGSYSFDNLPQGIYIVVPHDALKGFDPVYRRAQTGPDHPVVEANFTALTQELPSWRIWGFIWTFDATDPGAPGAYSPMAGVPVSIDPYTPEGEPFTVTTNEDGFYVAYEQPVGVYVITPGADGYTFQPAVREVHVTHETVTPMQNFVGLPEHGSGDPCGIVGSISGPGGEALPEINVKLIPANDPAGAGAYTDVDGYFSFEGLVPGKYIVVPTNPHRMFTPKYQVVVVEAGQTARCDFTGSETDAYYRVWGFTYSMHGEAANHFAPLAGVLVQARLDGSEHTYSGESNADGYWEITELPIGTYIVSASKDGFQFDPGSMVQVINGEALAPPIFLLGYLTP